MSARKLSIVSSNTFRGACGASADGALVGLTATLALARTAELAGPAETTGVAALGSGSDLQAAETKPQATNIHEARHAVVAAAAQRAIETRGWKQGRDES